MKKIMILAVAVFISLGVVGNSFAGIRYVNGYYRSSGTYVSGHYKDTSHDGNPYNNANYLGYNR
jgi:hypothetical protein